MTGTVPDETAVAIRVAMPQQLRTLARVSGQIEVTVEAPVTLGASPSDWSVRSPAVERDTRLARPLSAGDLEVAGALTVLVAGGVQRLQGCGERRAR